MAATCRGDSGRDPQTIAVNTSDTWPVAGIGHSLYSGAASLSPNCKLGAVIEQLVYVG